MKHLPSPPTPTSLGGFGPEAAVLRLCAIVSRSSRCAGGTYRCFVVGVGSPVFCGTSQRLN